MKFEDVELYDIQSVGQYLSERNRDLGISFYNFGNNEDDTIRQIMTVAALRILAYYMNKDMESEKKNVDELFDILQAFPDDEKKLEDFEIASDSLHQHEDELEEVQNAINEVRSNYELV